MSNRPSEGSIHFPDSGAESRESDRENGSDSPEAGKSIKAKIGADSHTGFFFIPLLFPGSPAGFAGIYGRLRYVPYAHFLYLRNFRFPNRKRVEGIARPIGKGAGNRPRPE